MEMMRIIANRKNLAKNHRQKFGRRIKMLSTFCWAQGL